MKPVPVNRSATRLAFLRQEVAAEAIDELAEGRLRAAAAEAIAAGGRAAQFREIVREHRELRMLHGPALQELRQTAGHCREQRGETHRGRAAGGGRREVPRSRRQIAPQDGRCDQPASEHPRQTGSEPALAQLRKHQRHIVVGLREAAADSQGAIERLLDQARNLGVVGEGEARVDIRFERKLAQQSEAEGIDGGNRDVAEPIAQIAPACGIERRCAARFFQALDDSLPHFGGRLAGEGDGQDVLGLDSSPQQVDVALDQHARLAGAGRSFEHDIPGWIDSGTPGRGVGQGVVARQARRSRWQDAGAVDVFVERQARLRRHRRSPCGTPL